MLAHASHPTLFLTAADSARAVGQVYAISLLATVPLVAAVAAALALRRTSAGARSLVWRCAIIALLIVFVGRLLPMHWMAWVVPATLAAPLVALGRVQVAGDGSSTLASSDGWPAALSNGDALFAQLLFAVYLAGVGLVLLPTVRAIMATRRGLRTGRLLVDPVWLRLLADTKHSLGVHRSVRLVVVPNAVVPATIGFLRPIIMLPSACMEWDNDARRMVLLHEMAHVRAGDWVFALLGRVTCALFWFHPAAWYIARRLRDECEVACDDRVLTAGIRASDYADLLVMASSTLRGTPCVAGAAVGLSARSGLRARLASVLDVRHDARPMTRRWIGVAATTTLSVAVPMSTVQLAPTRDVLTTLMTDARWESRAYAVLGLAQRADSVAVARSAAERDPSPTVRAWARYALGLSDVASPAVASPIVFDRR
jgi:beta-lactamase regulating signal transducer with metallopeptidase domain